MLEQTCLQRPNFFRSIQCWRNSGRCAACFAAFQLSSALGGGKVISLGGCLGMMKGMKFATSMVNG